MGTWSEINWIKYEHDAGNLTQIRFKNSLVNEEPFKILDISRKKSKRRLGRPENVLLPISNSPLKLSKEKLTDPKSLLPYIRTHSQMYYHTIIDNLQCGSNVDDIWSEFGTDDENDNNY